MIISENGLVKQIKNAYKNGGYTISANDERLNIFTRRWYVSVRWEFCPKKVLAAIVEHAGFFPNQVTPMHIFKGTDPQVVLPEIAADDIEGWNPDENSVHAKMTQVVIVTSRLFQTEDLQVWAIDEEDMLVVSAGALNDQSALIRRDSHLASWIGEGELVTMKSVRPTSAGGWNPEMVSVWEAMEAVDLTMQMKA